jgi:mRNA-degrading endonuclease RelE of RelBE toxin-antitoxin system
MKLVETSKFRKLRRKIKQEQEREQLKEAIKKVLANPISGKKLKGEFKELRSLNYLVMGQSRRLIYKLETDTITLFSFGPREGIYQ